MKYALTHSYQTYFLAAETLIAQTKTKMQLTGNKNA